MDFRFGGASREKGDGQMFTPFLIPIAVFAGICVIVGISVMASVRDKEYEVSHDLRLAEIEHRSRMAELQQRLDRVRQR